MFHREVSDELLETAVALAIASDMKNQYTKTASSTQGDEALNCNAFS